MLMKFLYVFIRMFSHIREVHFIHNLFFMLHSSICLSRWILELHRFFSQSMMKLTRS